MPTLFGTTPDYRELMTVIDGGETTRVPFFEFISDPAVQAEALGGWLLGDTLPLGGKAAWDGHIVGQYYLGYDYLSPEVEFGFPGVTHQISYDSEGNERIFNDDEHAPVQSSDDMERYAWPTPAAVDYAQLEYFAGHLPEGMKLIPQLRGGPLKWGMWMMGLENFCMGVYDDPEMVQELLARINAQQVAAAAAVASHADVCALAIGDDMGFKTQTFLPPAMMREFLFPCLKNIADAVHAQGKPFILHSCGNLAEVMDDLIDMVGIDAKHSYEDVIMPVSEAKARWGSRVAILGGMDMDVLCRYDEEALRGYVRERLAACAPGGGYAMGSGNAITNYVPGRGLRVMLEEAAMFSSAV